MRRLVVITALALFLAVPLWAQRGGGHSGGFGGGGHLGGFGSHAGFSGSHRGGFTVRSGAAIGGSRFRGGMRAGSVHSFNNARSGFSHRPFLHDGFGGRFRDRDRFRRFGFGNNCFGRGCGVGFGFPSWGYGYYDPFWWDWSNDDASFDADYHNNLSLANEMNQQSLEQQREMWRQQQEDGDQDVYAPNSSRSRPAPRRNSDPPAVSDPPAAPIIPPTVLVFRDQHREEIRNYAIVGQTLWNFAAQRTEKIPLATLDLLATVQANDDRGVTFRVPSLTEGQ